MIPLIFAQSSNTQSAEFLASENLANKFSKALNFGVYCADLAYVTSQGSFEDAGYTGKNFPAKPSTAVSTSDPSGINS